MSTGMKRGVNSTPMSSSSVKRPKVVESPFSWKAIPPPTPVNFPPLPSGNTTGSSFPEAEATVDSEDGGPEPQAISLAQIKEWRKTIFAKDKCLGLPLNKDLRTRKRQEEDIVFDEVGRGYDLLIPSCEAAISHAVLELLGHAAFSIYMCSPAAFLNKPLLLLDAIWNYLHTQMGLKGMCFRLFKNCYLYYRSNRGPSVYNRYK
jgi:hypothetical protein